MRLRAYDRRPHLARARPGAAASAALLCLAVSGCGPKLVQERLDPGEDLTLNTRWNDIDAHEAAVEMIESCIHSPWLDRYLHAHDDERPRVIIATVENKTDEHIDVEALTSQIRTELIHSGEVRFLEAKARDEILEEYRYQQSGVVRRDEAKAPGSQLGADYLLLGELSSIASELDDEKLVTYQVDLRLTNLLTSEIEWAESHKIKKFFKRKRYKG